MDYPVYLPLGAGPGAALATLSHPSPVVWELEMRNGQDNRLTVSFLRECLMKGLDIVEKDWRTTPNAPGALVISGRKNQQKFFSNGGTVLDEYAILMHLVGLTINFIRSRLREGIGGFWIYES